MSLSHRHSGEDRSTECARERVACANGVSHLNLRCGLERHLAWCEHVRAVYAAGEHEHIEVVLAKDEPALVLNVQARIAEHSADEHKLLVVDLKNVAALHALADNILCVEVLAQVDVEYLHAVGRCSVEELVDSLAAHHVALGERAPAHSLCVLGDSLHLVGERDVVPRHVLLNVVCWYALVVELHLHGAGWIRHARHAILQALLLELLHGLVSELVLAKSAHCDRVQAELTGVEREVSRCTTKFLTFRKHVPECLTESYYIFLFHSFIVFSYCFFE